MKAEWAPLGDVLHLAQDAVIVEVDGSYPSAGVLNRGRGLFDKGILAGSETSYGRLFRLSAGQVVYSKLFGWEGAVALVPEGYDGYFVSSEFPTFGVASDRVTPDYISHYLKSAKFTDEMARSTNGLGQRRQRVNINAFLRIGIPLPPRVEQERIAAHLSSLACRLEIAELPSVALVERLPRILGAAISRTTQSTVRVGELAINRQVVIHPGDDLRGASEFIGLEHIEPHTGRQIGSRPIGDETGRKLLFAPGQVTYGYLRPYLNKAWVADRTGLCSVEQFTLTPNPGVDPRVLSVVLRSDSVWLAAQDATNSLQLPRLSLGALMSFEVPDVRGLTWDSIAPAVERITDLIVREAKLRSHRQQLHDSILPAARNAIFDSMR